MILLTIFIAACILSAFIEYHIMRKNAEEINEEEAVAPPTRRFKPIMYVKEDELGYEGGGVVEAPCFEELKYSEN